MQHMSPGSSYQFVSSDLIQHPHFTERKTAEQRRKGPWVSPKQSWSKALHPGMLGILPAPGGAPQEGPLWKKRQLRAKVSGELCLWPDWLGWNAPTGSKSPGALCLCLLSQRPVSLPAWPGSDSLSWMQKGVDPCDPCMCLRAEQTQRIGAALCRAQACGVVMPSKMWRVLGTSSAPLYALSPLILPFHQGYGAGRTELIILVL